MGQRIRFCTAPDGVRIAYATSGAGPTLVRAATWLTHLEYDPSIYGHWLTDLGADRTLLRYDMRGCGLSDRDVRDLSLDARVSDLETVVDAAGLGRFALLGASGGGPVAVAYAARHPERVTHLVLYGSYAKGRAKRLHRSPGDHEEERLLVSLTRVGWGRNNPAYRRVFSTLFMPDASIDEVSAFDEVQRVSASPETAARIREASYEVDVTGLSGQVITPTLVMHVREDAAAPFEEGRRLATLIPGAQFVALDGRDHILRAGEPAWRQFVAELCRFLAEDSGTGPAGLATLTARERAVLRLVADGLDNELIATRLTLSVRTVERHLSNIYAKLGVTGKAARAAVAARFARS